MANRRKYDYEEVDFKPRDTKVTIKVTITALGGGEAMSDVQVMVNEASGYAHFFGGIATFKPIS